MRKQADKDKKSYDDLVRERDILSKVYRHNEHNYFGLLLHIYLLLDCRNLKK